MQQNEICEINFDRYIVRASRNLGTNHYPYPDSQIRPTFILDRLQIVYDTVACADEVVQSQILWINKVTKHGTNLIVTGKQNKSWNCMSYELSNLTNLYDILSGF